MSRRPALWLILAAAAVALLAGLVLGQLTAPTLVAQEAPPPATAAPPAAPAEPQGPGGPPPTPEDTAAGGDATPGDTPYAETKEARAAWAPVVDGLARTFPHTAGRSAKEWRDQVTHCTRKPSQTCVTPAVARDLATIDPRNVPSGHYLGHDLLEADEDSAAVRVTYREGWSLALFLLFNGESWQVSQYDRYEE